MLRLSLKKLLFFSSVVILVLGAFGSYALAQTPTGDGQAAITATMQTDMPGMNNMQPTATADTMVMPRLPNGEPMEGMQSLMDQMQRMINQMTMMMGMTSQQDMTQGAGTMGMGCMMGMGTMGANTTPK